MKVRKGRSSKERLRYDFIQVRKSSQSEEEESESKVRETDILTSLFSLT